MLLIIADTHKIKRNKNFKTQNTNNYKLFITLFFRFVKRNQNDVY